MANREKVLTSFAKKFKTRRNKDTQESHGPSRQERQRKIGRKRKMVEQGFEDEDV